MSYTAKERDLLLLGAASAAAPPSCPRCGTSCSVIRAGPRDDVAYVRDRATVRCPACRASAVGEVRRYSLRPPLRTGTSGFSYKEWRGTFYPEKLPPARMLEHYSRTLSSVEINSTFYRLPRVETLEKWASQTPPSFSFVLKASRRITHMKRLRDAEEPLEYLTRTATDGLGDRMGPILFQLPPFLRADVVRLREFLALLPANVRAAFEFRHESWQSDEVYQALADAAAALVIADTGDGEPPVVGTAPFGYARLRRPGYSRAELEGWAAALRRARWREAFVFFKHEDEGAGPRMAMRFGELWEAVG